METPEKVVPESTKLIIVEDQRDDAPNVFLNISRFLSQAELWIAALASILLQLGVLIYSGFITYYSTWKFQKDNEAVQAHAFPCTTIGTLLLVSGLILCSHVVESSTVEAQYRPNGMEARLVWLQKHGVVSDQAFGSFAIFAKEAKSTIITSRRAEADPVREIKAVLGTLVTLCGYVIQFVGLRGMHWSATVAQLGATFAMAVLRAYIRRDLITEIKTEPLPLDFELDWFATKLATRFFSGDLDDCHGPGADTPVFRDNFTTPCNPDPGKQAHAESIDWLITPATPLKDTSRFRKQASSQRQSHDELESWILKPIEIHDIVHSHRTQLSMAQCAVRMRKCLADSAPWPRLTSIEARAVTSAIEGTMNSLDPLFVPEDPSYQDDDSCKDLRRNTDTILGLESLTWSLESTKGGHVYFSVERQPSGKWKAPENDIEAALSLWWFSAQSGSNPELAMLPNLPLPGSSDSASTRTLRLLGPNSGSLRRDLGWWMPSATTRFVTVGDIRKASLDDMKPQYSETLGIIGCGSSSFPGWSERLRYMCKDLPWLHSITDPYTCSNIFVGVETDKPFRVLFAQHLFTAFMWAMVKSLRRPLQGRANVQAADLSQTSSTSWRSFTLHNVQLSRIAQEIQLTGLGSLEDAYLCILPPFSAASRLPSPASVIEWTCQHATNSEKIGRWEEAAGIHTWLWKVFSNHDPTPEKCTAVLVAFLVSLSLEVRLKETQKYPPCEVERLRKLKSSIETELRTADKALVAQLLRAWSHGSPKWISDATRTIELAQSKSDARGYEGDSHFAARNHRGMLGFPGRDRLNRTWVHHIAMSFAYHAFAHVSDQFGHDPDPDAQDLLGWTPLHFASFETRPPVDVTHDASGEQGKIAQRR